MSLKPPKGVRGYVVDLTTFPLADKQVMAGTGVHVALLHVQSQLFWWWERLALCGKLTVTSGVPLHKGIRTCWGQLAHLHWRDRLFLSITSFRLQSIPDQLFRCRTQLDLWTMWILKLSLLNLWEFQVKMVWLCTNTLAVSLWHVDLHFISNSTGWLAIHLPIGIRTILSHNIHCTVVLVFSGEMKWKYCMGCKTACVHRTVPGTVSLV